MSSLSSALLAASRSLQAFQFGMNVAQQNVSNLRTPGYAKQTLLFEADRFDPGHGQAGGVHAGQLLTSRDTFAEEGVRRQQNTLGRYSQEAAGLKRTEGLFPIGDKGSISGNLSGFFQALSSLAVNPNSSVPRQVVLDRARDVAEAFQQTGLGLKDTISEFDTQISDAVRQFNYAINRVAEINRQRSADVASQQDPALDAQLHQALEEMSEVVDFDAIANPDGSMTILLAGRTPVLVGDNQYPISAQYSADAATIRNSEGDDITGILSGGRIKGLLNMRNTTLPGYVNDVNTLAQNFADQLNTQLNAGVDLDGNPPAQGLFTYNATAGAAQTMAVTDLQPGQLAAALAGAPGGNGNALKLAALGTTKTIGADTFVGFYGNLAGRVGRDLEAAELSKDTATSLLTQAQNYRQELSGVSLDEEASHILLLQKNYEAAAQLFKVLSSMTDTLISMVG